MTATGRTTATRLRVGDRILVEPIRPEFASEGETLRSTTRKLTGKNDVVVATVQEISTYSSYGLRRNTTYRKITTDVGKLIAAPSQTFAVGPTLQAVEQEQDSCDRCHKQAERIFVSRVDSYPYEGLCDPCITELAATTFALAPTATAAQAAVEAQPLDATTEELTAAVAVAVDAYQDAVEAQAVIDANSTEDECVCDEVRWCPVHTEGEPNPAELDTESSVSRQHYIDTGRYLTKVETAESCSHREDDNGEGQSVCKDCGSSLSWVGSGAGDNGGNWTVVETEQQRLRQRAELAQAVRLVESQLIHPGALTEQLSQALRLLCDAV